MSKLTGIKYTVILEPEMDGGYSIHCPALPGCHSQGNTIAESITNIKEAILLIMDTHRDRRKHIPAETPEIVTEEIRQILKARAEDGLPLVIETHEIELPTGVPV
ncbi:MAG: type II toxin-antitoxin system HicB family antitoxin [Chloroflexi bacterium]|jgi:predicted RNase H-like HicB family nuclease|nr:type II toxin-antitoxin system HicB family antitoxin [Chloroflexota bacterium]